MEIHEWEHLVLRHNRNYPGQQVEPLTAAEWFDPLAVFPATEVWAAIDRHRRDLTPGRDGQPAGHWAPSLAGILACIDANWREAAAARREREAHATRTLRNGKVLALAPPEWAEIRRTLEASKSLPGSPGHMLPDLVRQRIQELVDQHNERVDRAKRGQLT